VLAAVLTPILNALSGSRDRTDATAEADYAA